MVTKKELSDFKQKLTTALQKAGYTAYGRISSSEENFNFYAHLPEQEMVSQYVEDNNLDEINRVYRVIKYINDNSGNNYSLKTLCKQYGVDYKVFNHAVENMPYLDKTGERRKTQYHWIHKEEPSFKTAKDVVDHMRKLKLTKLSKALKRKISKAVAEGISKEEFFEANNIRKDATYSAAGYFNYQRTQQKDDVISESLLENTPTLEETSVIDTELQDSGSVNGKPVIKDEESLTTQEVLDDAGLEMEIFILRQEIKYLKKINKAKDKLIKALRKKK